ncbi:hypothetical protein DCS_01399 [Drechmeria coniospora]|uniref:Pali-domain-containing protein n=1 Tax=Drechmeria coniospora TaxID=98403 RepID=A0A151GTC9_DRECN|nr:hypothetical protein DCS_01399 [Drechmeria coniospora]KYK60262.1 hypothetical protein DCS_01399 [Drechmeria coniospora]ODA80206.1 hypothetical protein RJ55_03164 [Drechmeria coniospora]
MGVGTLIHHIGTLLLLVATVLLLVVDVTAPVVNTLSILKVDLGRGVQGTQVTFGTFGYCHLNVKDTDSCSNSRIGYDPASVISDIDDTDFSDAEEATSRALTRVMVLHPVATALCFIAFLLCIATNVVGSIAATFFALLAFVVTIVALICDVVAFAIVKRAVNKNGRSTARWGSAIWLLVAAALCCLFAALVVFVTCCVKRSKKRRAAVQAKEGHTNSATPKRRFWQRSPRA